MRRNCQVRLRTSCCTVPRTPVNGRDNERQRGKKGIALSPPTRRERRADYRCAETPVNGRGIHGRATRSGASCHPARRLPWTIYTAKRIIVDECCVDRVPYGVHPSMPAILTRRRFLARTAAAAAVGFPATAIAGEKQEWGDLKGRFVYDGKPPERKKLKVDKDVPAAASSTSATNR